MKSRERRAIDIFNMSFLDVVSCGFGAIILLLVIVKVAEPTGDHVEEREIKNVYNSSALGLAHGQSREGVIKEPLVLTASCQ